MFRGDILEWHREGEQPMTIRGAKNKTKAVRFGKVLCAGCNSQRSQPFDRAYEVFSDYLVTHMDTFWRADGIDLEKVYGEEWEAGALALARYYGKNFGCLMADDGVVPPAALIRFMNGDDKLQDVAICLVKSESHYIGHKRLRKLGPNNSLWRPAGVAWTDDGFTKFTGYQATALVGFVGARFEWHEGWGEQDSFFSHPSPVLNKLAVTLSWRLGWLRLSSRNRASQLFGRVRGGIE
jgi:hypothetical protein